MGRVACHADAVASALGDTLAILCGAGSRVLRQVHGNPLAEVVAHGLEVQDGLAERRLVRDGRRAVGLVEVTVLEVGRLDAEAAGDVV